MGTCGSPNLDLPGIAGSSGGKDGRCLLVLSIAEFLGIIPRGAPKLFGSPSSFRTGLAGRRGRSSPALLRATIHSLAHRSLDTRDTLSV